MKLLALLGAVVAAVAPIPADLVAWVRSHAVPIGAPQSAPDAQEAATLHRIVAGAELIGLGEPFHGHAEPLLYRNRLIRHLVAHERLVAVALESGMADTQAAADYVLGGSVDARSAAAPMSWRFGTLADNVALVDWLRRWNDAHPRAKVRLYGIDVSGGDDKAGFGNARVALDRVDAFLARGGVPTSEPTRAAIARVAPHFSPAGYAAAGADLRAAISELPAALSTYLAQHRAALTRATVPDAFDQAARIALDAGTAARIFPVWPADATRISTGLLRATAMREEAMVAHTLWALGRERARGRVLLFQSNSHVAGTELVALNRPSMGDFKPTGAQLRAALAARYRVIGFTSAMGKPADDEAIGTVDRVFVAAGGSRVLLDLRDAPAWWRTRQTLAHGGVRVNAAVPTAAFDGLYFVDRLSPAAEIGGSK